MVPKIQKIEILYSNDEDVVPKIIYHKPYINGDFKPHILDTIHVCVDKKNDNPV